MNTLVTDRRVVIGLGTGRSGTASLTSLIDRQHGGMCFHEMNPACAVFAGNPQPQLNAVTEFRRILLGGDRRLLTVDYSRPSSVASYERLQASARLDECDKTTKDERKKHRTQLPR